MIGMQNSLDRILVMLQTPTSVTTQSMPPPAFARSGDGTERQNGSKFPPLPGFAAPVCDRRRLGPADLLQPHKYATYGIVPSTAPSSDDESEDTLPRSTLNAPIEALQGLANAAAEAAAAPSTSPPR